MHTFGVVQEALSVLRPVSENDCSLPPENTVSTTLLKRHMSFTLISDYFLS